MALVIKEISTDLALRGITPVVHAVQGDINRVIQVNFLMNKAPYNVEGLSYCIQYSKPDGTRGKYDTLPDGSAAGTLSGNTGGFYLAPQVLTVPGIVKLNIALINSAMTIHTFSVTIDVEKNPGYEAESDDYVNVKYYVPSSGWDPNKYLGTDADGNVVAVDAPEGGSGTVKTVNGVEPDENGNVEVKAEVPKAASMDLSNFDGGSFSVTYVDGTVSEFGVAFDDSGRPVTISDGTTDFAITWGDA